MTQKELNSLKKLIKVLQDGGVMQFTNGALSLTLNEVRPAQKPTKAVNDISALPKQKTPEEEAQELLYYSGR